LTAVPHTDLTNPVVPAVTDEPRDLTPRGMAWRRFRSNRMAVVGLVILGLLVLAVLVGPLLYRVDPNAVDPLNYRKPPGVGGPLGSDSAGRDVLARLLVGGRISLTIGLCSAAIATAIGIVLGVVSGYFRGRVDGVLTRAAEVFQTFPTLIIIIVIVALVGSSLPVLILGLGLLQWTQAYRVSRSVTMGLREQDSVLAIDGLGGSSGYILRKHLVPAVLPHATVAFTLLMATVVMTEAGLSFLGLGVPPPTSSWGGMITEAQQLTILRSMPWMWAPPGIAIAVTILAVNFVGDGLRDAVDPRQAR